MFLFQAQLPALSSWPYKKCAVLRGFVQPPPMFDRTHSRLTDTPEETIVPSCVEAEPVFNTCTQSDWKQSITY